MNCSIAFIWKVTYYNFIYRLNKDHIINSTAIKNSSKLSFDLSHIGASSTDLICIVTHQDLIHNQTVWTTLRDFRFDVKRERVKKTPSAEGNTKETLADIDQGKTTREKPNKPSKRKRKCYRSSLRWKSNHILGFPHSKNSTWLVEQEVSQWHCSSNHQLKHIENACRSKIHSILIHKLNGDISKQNKRYKVAQVKILSLSWWISFCQLKSTWRIQRARKKQSFLEAVMGENHRPISGLLSPAQTITSLL